MRFFAGKNSSGKAKPQPKKNGSPNPAPMPISLDTWLDICGIALIGVAALTLFGLLSTQRSPFISGWLDLVGRLFGWGVYLAPLIMAALGAYLLIRRFGDRFPRFRPARLGGAVMAYLTALATLHGLSMIASAAGGADLAAASQGGGELGWLLLSLLISLLGNIGAGFVIVVAWIGAAMLITGVTISQLGQAAQRAFTQPKRDPAASSVARVPGAPTDDIIEPDYDGGLIIRGLKPRKTARQRPRSAGDEAPAAPTTDLPPARTISDAPSRDAPSRTAGAPGTGPALVKINTPTSRGQINRVPPPRIIGAPSGAPEGAVGHTTASGPAQPAPGAQPAAAAPAIAISSIYHLRREWKLPKVEDVLEPGSDAAMKEAEIRQRAALIEDTLRAFGVPSRVVEVNRGPTITQFGVEPGFNEMKGGKQVKVKVSRIAALADDLALALAAPRIRIEAPIPGRALVGIEVPNGETSLVSLRDVMESEEFEALQRKTRLRLALGQDVSGRPVVADLTSMPHLLIAGTTGSGKSVCVNAIIVALLCTNSPDDLRFLMIDPKRVELIGYNGIPHLIAPVVVDLEKTTAALQWVTREMDSRYRLFAKHGARNIVEFNAKVAAAEGSRSGTEGREPANDELRKLPYIVVVIDELADLMMMAPDETEKVICRLAQMARATGIHLILATQRPSVDVVTGLIKANFPARIAFTVATSVDSRVILDGPGAEKLLGRGDMLVVTPDQSMPMRAQGCYLGPEEIERVVRHWRGQLGDQAVPQASPDPARASTAAPVGETFVSAGGTLDSQQASAPEVGIFSAPPTWEEARALSEAAGEVSAGSKDDKLFNEAVATVRLQGKASISLLQRRLRIGYTRAARLIEEMEERGIIGPAVPGQQHREVLNSSLSGTDELS
jgi:S-DNA-T family DNA segregation ATPase FtsK/SpoIIIE